MKVTQNLRREPRFTFDRSVPAGFGPFAAWVVNISQSGVQLEHRDPLHLGASSYIVIPIPSQADRVSLRGHIVWSHLSPSADIEGKYLYRSGVELEEDPDAAALVNEVIGAYDGQPAQNETIISH